MQLVTPQSRAAEYRKAYLAHFGNHADHADSIGRVRALSESPTPEELDAASGTTGWCDMQCDECGEDGSALVHLGAEPDYDARWQQLCFRCLLSAAELLVAGDPVKEFALAVLRGEGDAEDAVRDVLKI